MAPSAAAFTSAMIHSQSRKVDTPLTRFSLPSAVALTSSKIHSQPRKIETPLSSFSLASTGLISIEESTEAAASFLHKYSDNQVLERDVEVSGIHCPPALSLRHQLGVEDGLLPANRPAVVGHRGALYDEPQNTSTAFVRCTNHGCDAVEMDVFLLRDDTLVVFHGGGTDEDPGDLTEYCKHQDGKNILDLNYAESQLLEFDPDFAEFPCAASKVASAKIPLLSAVLRDLKDTACNVKIELKGPGTAEPALRLVEELGMLDRVQFSSFIHERLRVIRELRPERDQDGNYVVRTGALFSEVPADFLDKARRCGSTEIHLRYDTCTRDRVESIHEAGLCSMVWVRGPRGMTSDSRAKFSDVGNEDSAFYSALIATGVQQICCNRPVEALRLLDKIYGT